MSLMLGPRITAAIAAAWQHEIETKSEAGQTPLLDLNSSELMLTEVSLFMALQGLVSQRVDLTAPLFVAGGNSPLWLAALLFSHPHRPPPQADAPTLVFAGADRVTYLATRTTLTPAPLGSARPAPGALPADMLPLFLPHAQPKPAFAWDVLPFAVAEERTFSYFSPGGQAAPHRDAWVGWVAISFAVLLIVLAFFT